MKASFGNIAGKKLHKSNDFKWVRQKERRPSAYDFLHAVVYLEQPCSNSAWRRRSSAKPSAVICSQAGEPFRLNCISRLRGSRRCLNVSKPEWIGRWIPRIGSFLSFLPTANLRFASHQYMLRRNKFQTRTVL
jgi:hypothetical protein